MQALQQHAIEVDTLFLGQNRIGSFGASCLAQYLASSPQKLRSLSISDNPITDEGAHTIVGALPACASLATLSCVFSFLVCPCCVPSLSLSLGMDGGTHIWGVCVAQRRLSLSPHTTRSFAVVDNRMRGCQGVSSQARERLRMTWGGREGSSVFGLYI